MLAWRTDGDAVVVLLRPDATVEGIAELKRVLNRPLITRAVEADTFAAELSRVYNQGGAALAMSEGLANEADLARLMQDLPASEDLLDGSAQAPVIRMINALLLQALRERASDLHFEPYEARAVVRFRVDGMLHDVVEPPRALHGALVSRLKIMAGLDIAEKRLPQDGRIALKLGDRQVDVRVSTLPTGAGERVVLRLLDQEAARLDLATLGMSGDTLATIDALIRQPHGILLVTGPTGSGKTTTLYAGLSRLLAADASEQRAIYDREWNTVAWRALSRLAASRSEVAAAFRVRAETLLRDLPVRGNYLLHAFLLGRYADLESAHAYFSRSGFDALRNAAIEITATPAGDFDGIVLDGTRSIGTVRSGTAIAWWGEATPEGVGDVRTLGPDRSPLDGPLRIGVAR